jgi:Spy/CpxP family protein refolding chaperone
MKQITTRGWMLAAGLCLAVAAHAEDAPAPAPAPVAELSSAPATPASPVDAAAAGLREHHRHHGGGLLRFVAMSLDTLGAADDAKRPEIGKLQAELQASLAASADAEKELLETLAEGIEANKIDTAKMDEVVAKQATAAAARREAGYETINKLHALLTPVERAALADKVQAHWEVWRQVNQPATAAEEQKGRLDELAQEVALVPDQQEKIAAALKATTDAADTGFDPKRAEARIQAFTKGFVAAKFDGKTISAQQPVVAGRGSKRMVRFYEAASPILTRVQRKRLAYDLRQDAIHQSAAPAEQTASDQK